MVGSRVRELRQALNMTMSTFAAEADISLGMLSKIEHGQSAPSLSTLVRLAATARVPVTALFRGLDEEHDLVIVRSGEGHEIHHQGGGPGRLYQDLGTLRGPNRVIEPMITTITEPGGVFPLYQHPGVEFLHVLEGSLDYGYGGTAYRLNPGDTMQIHGEVAPRSGRAGRVADTVHLHQGLPGQRAANRGRRMTPWAASVLQAAARTVRAADRGGRLTPWACRPPRARRGPASGPADRLRLAERTNPGNSIVLWILLAGAVGLTFWECRERGYRLKITLWWVSLVAITHVLGYIVLRFLVRPPREA